MDLFLSIVALFMLVGFCTFLFERFGKERYIGSTVFFVLLVFFVGGARYLNSGEISRIDIDINKYDRVTDDGLELSGPMYFLKMTSRSSVSASPAALARG